MQQSRMRPGIAGLLVFCLLFGLVVGLVTGVGVDRLLLSSVTAAPATQGANAGNPTSTTGASGASGLDYNLVNQAWNLINANYVDRSAVKNTPLTYGAISGMVDALGDTGHSRFLSPDDLKQEQQLTSGEFEGIGAEVDMENGRVVIVTPLDGSPAQKAGLQPGDVILQVNGKSTEGQTLQQVVNQVLGPAGTQVRLTILTPKTNKTRDVTITRARIVLRNVTWSQIPGTTLAHVRIAEFSNGVSRDLQTALQAIQQQRLTGIVLDLRNDPGGLLDEAVATTSDFIDKGNVLLEKDSQGRVKAVPVEQGPVSVDLPMTVLINQGTASASEIVAGALDDAQRAKLVGDTTFGTGTVLNQFPLSDGSALLLATQEWLTPSGKVIWHNGITPDVPVSLAADAQMVLPEAEQNMTAQQLQSSSDTQLLKAISLLSNSGQ